LPTQDIVISLDVRDYMATKLITLDPDDDILSAAHILIKHEISGAPVVDNNDQMVGILTERDCMRVALQAEYYGMPGGRVKEFIKMFIEGTYNRYPVVENERLIGQISRRDVMRALGKQYPLKT